MISSEPFIDFYWTIHSSNYSLYDVVLGYATVSRNDSKDLEVEKATLTKMFVDGWLTKEVKEENSVGIEEFDKDSMKVGVQSRERHNLSKDILFRKLQAQTKSKDELRSIVWFSSSSIFSVPLLPFSVSSWSPSFSSPSSSSVTTAVSSMFSE